MQNYMSFRVFNFKISILAALIYLMPWTISGQSHELLTSFKAEKNSNRVILNWSIKQGNTCVGINILRAADTLNFVEIGNIQGICGSTEFEQRFTFVDDKPLPNQTNYYKLELGFSGRTEPPLKIDYDYVKLENNESKVVPNPNSGFGSIIFVNPYNQNFKIHIKDSHGRPVDTYESEAEIINFDVTHQTKNPFGYYMPANSYNYFIMDETGNIVSTGQFIVINQ
jgi:hypothetical protein